MATLEVHNGRGDVEYVTIAPSSTALIGSDPKCDVVLSDPRVLPIHGRLRWKHDRLKIEATPEARFLEVNGKQVVASKLKQGDEIRIGPCRLFLLHEGDGAPDTEKTRVQAPPVADAVPAATPAPAASRPATAPSPWLADLEMAPPSFDDDLEFIEPGRAGARVGGTEPIERSRSSRRQRQSQSQSQSQTPSARPGQGPSAARPVPAGPRILAWWRSLVGEDRPPGDERILTSPMVIGLIAAIALLVVFSGLLLRTISRRTAAAQYQLAVDTYRDGDYVNAIHRFDQFLERQPNDERAPRARALRALANVRQFTAGGAPAWKEGLEAARGMIDAFGEQPIFEEVSPDLAEDVLRIAEGLSDRARAASDPSALAEAEAAAGLHAQLAGPAAESLQARSRLPAKLATARAAVLKGQTRKAALAEMDAALKKGSAPDLYAVRDRLVASYADQATDAAVVERLTRANSLLQRAVTFDPSTRPAELGARSEPLGPPTTLVLRSDPAATEGEAAGVVFALAEGLAYGLDEASGAPLWQLPVGLSAPFPPQPVAGSPPTALVVDARSDELVRLEARSGRVLWRQSLGETVTSPPLLLGNDLYQSLPGGKLLQIDLESGELRGTFDLGKPLATSPVADELGQHLYVLADRASLFVLQRDPPTCVAVEYLGHDTGSILCPPARLSRYLIVPINTALSQSEWRIFLLEDEGARVRPIQTLPVPGWTWSTPASSGSVLWTIGDRGGLTAYAIGSETATEPFRKIAQISPDMQNSGPSYARARSERELWISSGRTGGFTLSAERGSIDPAWQLVDAGPAVGPIQFAGRLAVLTHQAAIGRGVTLWGVDPGSGRVVWQTILGAPWTVPPRPATSRPALTTLGSEGQPLDLPIDDLRGGGFVTQPIPRAGPGRLPVAPAAWLQTDEVSILVPQARSDHLLVRASEGSWKPIPLPAPLAARPVAWGGNLLVPAGDGSLYLLDPRTGASRADPYVPPFDRSKPVRWQAPVVLDSERLILPDESGRLQRLSRQERPHPRLVATGEATNLGSPLAAEPVAIGPALVLATADGRIRALATRDLSPLGIWTLAAPRAAGPTAAGDLAVILDTAGHVLAIDPEGHQRFVADLGSGPPAGPPVVIGEILWVLARDGALVPLSLKDGKALDRLPLEPEPAGGPLRIENALAIPIAPGTLRLLEPPTP